MAKEENYYGIEKKIYDVLQKFEIVTQENVLDIYSEAQSLIFEYDILKNYYSDKVKNALKLINSEEYKSIIKSNYDKVKKFVKHELKNKNVKILYTDEKKYKNQKIEFEYELSASKFPYPNYLFIQNQGIIIDELIEEGLFDFDTGNIPDDWYDNCTSYAELLDIPSLFIYESVLSLNLSEYNEESVNNVPILNWNNLTEFYLETFGHRFIELIKIPQIIDIEYLIVALNIGKYTHKTRFHLYIAITCLCVIFNDLLKVIYQKLENLYGFEIPEKNKYKQHTNLHTYIVKIWRKSGTINHLFIDDKPVKKISKLDLDFIEDVYKNIYDTEKSYFNTDPYLSKRKCDINKNILDLIGNEVGKSKTNHLIIRDTHNDRYVINTQLYNIQLIN